MRGVLAATDAATAPHYGMMQYHMGWVDERFAPSHLPAGKRLYMTATPRIYGDAVKAKADEAAAILTSMDDEDTYGPEFHRLGFGEAVEMKLLADYKVMVLVVPGDAISETFQSSLAGGDPELRLDDAAKIVGITKAGHLSVGARADVCVFDPAAHVVVTREGLKSQGKNTPFLGMELPGKVHYTLVEGQVMFEG